MTQRTIPRDVNDDKGRTSAEVASAASRYAVANPVRLSDPTGRCPVCLFAAIFVHPVSRGAIIGGVSYLAGQVITNRLEGRALNDGISGMNLTLSITAGALTGGLVPEAAPILQRIVSGGLVAGGTEGARQLVASTFLSGRPDANRIGVAAGFGMYGGLYRPTGIVIAVGITSLLDATQSIADSPADAKEPPASAAPGSAKGH
jgi:hypothetical protein